MSRQTKDLIGVGTILLFIGLMLGGMTHIGQIKRALIGVANYADYR